MITRLLLAGSLALSAATPEQALQILEKNCWSCHAGAVALSGLRLDSRAAALQGGKRGAALLPGKSSSSLLLRAITHADPKLAMPPGARLGDADVAVLREWVDAGAAWPASPARAVAPQWWSFRKPAASPGSIDTFIAAKLREKGLASSPAADRRTLIRRVTFDLHGLAPSESEITAFVNDANPKAYESLVDRLLASPHYGEKWGKHWLDLVRYGDTAGFEQDPYTLYAWRYRDYVIKSFNDDKPYDRFIKEQIAGDELYEDPEAQQGTGYFCVGPNRDMLYKVEDINRVESLTDFVDTTSSVFLGLSVGCARCHDHKYDPISQRDYYRMQAIFAPFQKTRVFLHYNNARGYDLGENTRTFKLYDISAEIGSLKAPYQDRLRQEKLSKLSPEIQAAFTVDENQRTPQQKAFFEAFAKQVAPKEDEILALMTAADKDRLQRAEKRLAGLYNNYAPGPFSPGLTDVGREAPRTYLPAKGVPPPGEEVGPGLLTVLGGKDIPEPPPASATTQRRRALAEWLASADNPLTARVMVNRVWQYHFGRGLVATPSDFGTRGAAPSHPELLDTLAAQFVQNGWSVKTLHRQILLSETYRRSSRPTPQASEKDPENQYLSHFRRRRLDAEEVRDAVLQSAGTLNAKMYGRAVVPALQAEELYGMSQPVSNAWVVTADVREHSRRSIYMISRRNFRMPLLEVFDRPEGVLSCSRRESSTTAPQSLTLLNGEFTLLQARALAEKALTAGDGNVAIAEVFRRVYAREPNADELKTAAEFLDRQSKRLGTPRDAVAELARGLLNTNEFLYLD
ncbi:MAG TPA: PSD1 and planctomycete cytochrome C domain-containing protein [Bryobacteraceae bacterium]|nr:PSD1 and planctomycete cytochrome C domain-containing protein [Bryobacteraceae bacterium]